MAPKKMKIEKKPGAETAKRSAKAALQLRSMAKPGNRTQFFRLLAMQKPARKPTQKEADK